MKVVGHFLLRDIFEIVVECEFFYTCSVYSYQWTLYFLHLEMSVFATRHIELAPQVYDVNTSVSSYNVFMHRLSYGVYQLYINMVERSSHMVPSIPHTKIDCNVSPDPFRRKAVKHNSHMRLS